MKTYKVKIERTAEADLHNLFRFLVSLMSREGANRYIDTLITEVQSLSILADLYRPSRQVDVRRFHPKARRMVSHNKKWFISSMSKMTLSLWIGFVLQR